MVLRNRGGRSCRTPSGGLEALPVALLLWPWSGAGALTFPGLLAMGLAGLAMVGLPYRWVHLNAVSPKRSPVAFLSFPKREQRHLFLLLGLIFLALPLLWASGGARPGSSLAAGLRVGALLYSGFWLWCSATSAPMHLSAARAGLWVTRVCLLTAIGAATVGIVQVVQPGWLHALGWAASVNDGLRAESVFRKSNLLASFCDCALGVLICLSLWHVGPTRVPSRVSRGWDAGLALCVALLVAGVLLAQSTVGGLGLLSPAALWWACRGRNVPRSWALLLGAVLGGVAGLSIFGHGDVLLVSHAVGRAGRLQMWEACLWLIAQRPVTGWGYGSFAGVYPQALHALHQVQIDHAVLVHPHNELLLWTVEGGMIAALGLVCLLTYGVLLCRAAVYQGRRDTSNGRGVHGVPPLAWVVCAAPLLLHTQVEYPFYQSPLSLVLCVALLGLAESSIRVAVQPATQGHPCSYPPRAVTAIPAVLLGLGLLWWTWTGWQVARALNAANDSNYSDVALLQSVRHLNPWFMRDETAYALNMHALVRFNATRDPVALPSVAVWMRGYLQRHPDPVVYLMLASVQRASGQQQAATRTLAEAAWRVSWDRRLASPEPTNPQASGTIRRD